MSSMAAGGRQERMNRWLLIGAVALAIIAGILVFLVVANAGSNSSSSNNTNASGAGGVAVLVANQTIPANTTITANMLDVRSVATADLVPRYVTDKSAVIGQATRTDILKNQQISFDAIAASVATDTRPAQLVPPGMRGASFVVGEDTDVAGLIHPGDRVDVLGIFHEKQGDQDVIRVETLLQNILVLAFAQNTEVVVPPPVSQPTAAATPTAVVGGDQYGRPPGGFKADPSAHTVTLALEPLQVELLLAAKTKGSLSLSLRRPDDQTPVPVARTFMGDFGFLPPTPAP